MAYFYIGEDSSRDAKYIDEKCLYCSFFFCFLTLHAGTGGIHKFFGFLIMLVSQLHFELVVRSEY